MKKRLIAVLFCLAICVCACFAMADPAPEADWEVTGVTEGLTTHDSIQISVTVEGADSVGLFTCDETGNATCGIGEQEGSTCSVSWATDTGGEYWFKAVAYFGEEEYEFIYSDQPICVNSSEDPLPVPTVTISDTFAVAGGYAIDQGRDITFRFTENPALFDHNGDRLPEHEDIWYTAYLYRMNGENQPVQLIGEPMGNINAGTEYSFGTYELIGGETYCISVDIQQRGYDGVAVNALFLVNPNQEFGLRGDNEPRITVDPDTGVISAPMHQWIVFRVTAPNAGCVRPYCLDAPLGENEGLPEGAEPFDEIWTNGSPISDFQWVTNTLPKDDQGVHVVGDYSKYFYVQIDYDDGISRLIGGLQLDVKVEDNTMHSVGFTVVDNITEVARDGRLFVNVNNYYQDEENNNELTYTSADYYGIYIGSDKDDDKTWLADSHWVKVPAQSEGKETTQVPLTVPRCEPGEYTAHVFAIKFGEPQLDLGDIPITVTEYNGCPFILSMGNEFVSGDPLRVYAHYTDPDQLNGWMTIRIVNSEDPDDVVFWDTQGYKDFWNDTSACWHEGTFQVEAEIWCWSLEEGNHIHERYPNEDYPKPWIITVTATDDDKDKIEVHEPLIGKTNEEDPTGDPVWLPLTTTDIKAGEDLKLKILKPDYADSYEVQVWYYHPEWGFENFLFEGYELTEDETLINISKNDIPDANPMQSTEIYIGVHGLGRNKNDKGKTWGYPVMPKTATGEVILTVDGSGENNTVLVNKDISLAVTDASYDPDETRQIQMACIFSEYGFMDYHGPDDDGVYRDAISFEDEGQYQVFALVSFDEKPEGFEWWQNGDKVTWYATNTVEVTATAIDQVGEFSFTLDDSIEVLDGCATVERGRLIHVTYTPAAHATNYWIDIDRYEDEWGWGWIDHVADLHVDNPADLNTALTAVMSTARLEAGKYRIRAVANGEGYLRRETEDLELNITEPENGGIIFNVDVPLDENRHGTIPTSEDIRMSAYAPGANWIEVLFDYDHFDFTHNEGWSNDWGGDSFSAGHQYGNSGEYKMVARAWYWDDDNDTYYCEESDPIELTVTANGGIVEVTRPDNLPVYIELGTEDDPADDLVFTVAKPKNAAFYRTEVWYDNPYTELYKDNDVEEENTEVIIPADSLPKDERRIRVRVRGWGYNLEADEKTWDIPMVPAASDKVTLTMTGLGEENILPVNTDAKLRVAKTENTEDEIQTICVFGGYNYWGHEGPDEDGAYERNISFGDEGTFAVYAMVTFDQWNGEGEDTRNWYSTNVVTVNTTATGDLGPFSYELNKNNVTRGDLITVTYTPETETDFDVHYWVDIGWYNENGEWYYLSNEAHVNSTNGGTATILTAWMEAGTYYLRARSNAPGYVGWEPENDIAITVTEPENNGFIFTVDVPLDANRHGTVHTSEDIRMSAYAPGASFIEVLFDYDHFNFEDHEGWRDDWDGDFFRTSHQYGNSGEYKIAARAWCPAYDEVTGNPIWEKDEQGYILTDDEGNNIQEYHWIESDPIVLNVIATGGSVTVAKPEGLPDYIMAGTNEDLTFTVEQPENAEYYEINVWCDGPDGVQYADNGIEDLSRTVTIPSGELPHEENLIRVRVRGWGYNVEADEETWDIPVIPAPDSNVTLSLDGLGQNNTIPVNKDATLRVEKMQEEDREIRTICVYDGRGEWNHEGPDNDGAYERDISFDNVGTYAVYAKVTFDTLPENFDWENDEDTRRWFYTNTEVVTVEKNGDIGAFTFSVDCDINEQYGYAEAERGQIVTVTYEPAEHATHYWIDVERYDDDQREWRWVDHTADLFVDDPEDENTVWTATMMTAEFDSEHSYRIRAAADAEGYVRSYTDNLSLEIAEPSTDDIIFTVDVPEVNGVRSLPTSKDYQLSVYAPGADWIDIFFDYDNYDFDRNEGWYDNWGGDGVVATRQYGNSGVYSLVARAWYPRFDETGNPIWEEEEGAPRLDDENNPIQAHFYKETDPIELTVTATGESVIVTRPDDLPAYIELGTEDDLTFTVTKPDNAIFYRTEVWYDDPYTELYKDNDVEAESTEVTIPAERLPKDERRLRVKVRGWGYNLEADEKTWDIPMVPAASDKVTLTMTGLGVGNTIPVNTDAKLLVEKTQNAGDEIQTVYIYGGYGYWNHEGPDEDGSYERNISFGDEGTFAVYAMVTFDQWNGEGEDPRTWYATNVVTVNTTATGDLGPFSYELNKNNVTRGELITVTYTPEDETGFDVHYWVDIGRYNEYGNWEGRGNEAHLESKTGGTATLATSRLEEGTYYLRARSNAPGYVGWESEDEIEITVTEPASQDIIFNVDMPVDGNGARNLVTGQDYTLSVYAPGADWVDVIFDYVHYDLDRNEGWKDDWWGWNSVSDRRSYSNSGTYTLVARGWYPSYDENTGEAIYYPIESAPIVVTVTANGGIVEVTRPEDLPAYIELGTEDDLTFTVTKPDNAIFYRTEVWYDDPYTELYKDNDVEAESTEVTIPAERLPKDERRLRVKVRGWGYNLEADEKTWDIPIVPAASGEVVLTMDGLGEDITLPVNKDAKLRVAKAENTGGEIQTVCVYGGYGYWDYRSPDEDGAYECEISFGDNGSFAVYAMVELYDQNDDTSTWVYTNAVTVNVTARGQANPFTIDVPSQVYRGDKIQVTINMPEGEGVDPDFNADNYWISLRDMDGFDWRWIEPNHIAEIDTTNLAPENYQVHAGGNSEGLITFETPWETITVTDPQMGEEQIRFRVNGGTEDVTAQIAENLEVSVIAPGAVRVGFFEDGKPWHEDENGQYCWADSCDSWYISDLYWMFSSDVGRHELKAAALFSEDGDWVVSEPIYVTITKEGNLSFDISGIPPYFTASEGKTFTIPLPDNADWMRIRAYRVWDTGSDAAYPIFDEPELHDDYTVTIPSDKLAADEEIWIEMEAFGLGYASDHVEKHIPVLPESVDAGATLVCENIDPDENGIVNVILTHDLEIALVPDNGKVLSAVRFNNGRGFWGDYQGEELNMYNHPEWFRTGEGEDGAFHVCFNYDWNEDVGLHTIFAYYKLEEDEDWSMAEPIVVNVSALGTVGAYDFVPSQERTITVARGETVTFEFTAAADADYYWLDAFSGEGESWRSWDPDRISDGRTVTLYTAGLPAGEYEIWGRAGRNGWIWTESDSCVKLTVTEESTDPVNLIIKNSVLTNENVHWSVFAPNAENIAVEGYTTNGNGGREYFFYAGIRDWNDTTYTNGECRFTGHEGTAYVDVSVWYPGIDEPQTYTTQITVSAPNGNLTSPKYRSAPWYAGQDLNLTIEPDQNTEWYRIEDVWDAQDSHGETYYQTPGDQAETGTKVLNLPYSEIGNAHIGISIHQCAVGYNDCMTTVYIRPIDTTGQIVLPSALTAIEEEAFEGNPAITHVLIPDGVTSIGNHAFCNCGSLLTVEIRSGNATFGTNVFDAGNITIYGYSGSTAESYAKANGIPFVSID